MTRLEHKQPALMHAWRETANAGTCSLDTVRRDCDCLCAADKDSVDLQTHHEIHCTNIGDVQADGDFEIARKVANAQLSHRYKID